MDIKDGDRVRIVCKDRSIDKNDIMKVFEGKVVSVFNAFDKNGDNWHIEVRGPSGGWFLYKPNIDGGTIEKI
jgi:hypothetical protein